MTVKEVAQGLVGLCNSGHFEQAMNDFYADDIVSVEPEGENAVAKGIEAVRAKGEWWYANFTVNSVSIQGPYINGDQFIVYFSLDVTEKASGKQIPMNEAALYTVKDGKIVHESFFNAM